MGKENKIGRPIVNNADYFPHICKEAKELIIIQQKYKPKRCEAFYRLQ